MELRRKNEPIVVEQNFNVAIGKVWSAITDGDQMKQWFFKNIGTFKPEVGFETRFNVQSNGKNYLHIWKITDVKPERKISYTWRYGGYPGNSLVTWELTSENDLVQLKLTHQGIESFPEDNPDFSRESCLEGWNFFIHKRLNEFLNNYE